MNESRGTRTDAVAPVVILASHPNHEPSTKYQVKRRKSWPLRLTARAVETLVRLRFVRTLRRRRCGVRWQLGKPNSHGADAEHAATPGSPPERPPRAPPRDRMNAVTDWRSPARGAAAAATPFCVTSAVQTQLCDMLYALRGRDHVHAGAHANVCTKEWTVD